MERRSNQGTCGAIMIHNLFPIPIGMYKIDRDLTDEELSFVNDQSRHDNTGNTTSNERTVLKHDALSNLNEFIEESLKDYFQSVYEPKNEVELQITQSWLNYTEPGQFHHKHAHPNSFVSGVFYVHGDREKDRIFFYKDGYQQIKLPTEDWNAWNSESWWFEAGTGDLILFPSSLTHMVPTTESDQTRISLSFNTFPVGEVGKEEELTGLHVEGAHG